jgi:hypothetical protein
VSTLASSPSSLIWRWVSLWPVLCIHVHAV